jgi:glycosyltransferase involved in cell wall biosynthesis
MNKGPIVSIVTPCYNGEKHIHRYLDSLLAQTYSNIELIFVNDGSSDNTEKIVLSYTDKFESKGIKLSRTWWSNQCRLKKSYR